LVSVVVLVPVFKCSEIEEVLISIADVTLYKHTLYLFTRDVKQ